METTGIQNEELEKLREDVQEELARLSHILFMFGAYVPYLLDSGVLLKAYDESLDYLQDCILGLSYSLKRSNVGIDPFILKYFYRYSRRCSNATDIT